MKLGKLGKSTASLVGNFLSSSRNTKTPENQLSDYARDALKGLEYAKKNKDVVIALHKTHLRNDEDFKNDTASYIESMNIKAVEGSAMSSQEHTENIIDGMVHAAIEANIAHYKKLNNAKTDLEFDEIENDLDKHRTQKMIESVEKYGKRSDVRLDALNGANCGMIEHHIGCHSYKENPEFMKYLEKNNKEMYALFNAEYLNGERVFEEKQKPELVHS